MTTGRRGPLPRVGKPARWMVALVGWCAGSRLAPRRRSALPLPSASSRRLADDRGSSAASSRQMLSRLVHGRL